MKIGILSMQRVENHGSFLQSYALKSILRNLGHEVVFLDIKKGELIASAEADEYHSEKRKYTPQEFLGRLLVKIKSQKQKNLFKKEQKEYLNLSEYDSSDEICDVAIIGSDEVFNCTTNAKWGLSTQLFGDIKNAEKTITYAASCGGTTYESVPEKYHGQISQALNKLSAVSVRDGNTFRFVKSYYKGKIEEHLDPVLIYDFEKEIKQPKINMPYLLVYSYQNRIQKKAEIESIKSFAAARGLKTVAAGIFQYWCDYNIPADSFEVLGYFQNADYIVTDTFHGSVMSIKFHKDFTVFVRESNQNKLLDLLKKFNLDDRCVKFPSELLESAKKIDYSSINNKIEYEKQRTIDYLKLNL